MRYKNAVVNVIVINYARSRVIAGRRPRTEVAKLGGLRDCLSFVAHGHDAVPCCRGFFSRASFVYRRRGRCLVALGSVNLTFSRTAELTPLLDRQHLVVVGPTPRLSSLLRM